jgi:uncharacterized SAM-binding protein YcdF (DUF218 family)
MTQAEGGASMSLKRIGRRLLIVLAVLAVLTAAAVWAFRNVGRWLVVSDALQPARAIVILSGSTPRRAMEAAEIYRRGWAAEVWLLKDSEEASGKALARLGIHYISGAEYDQAVLERLGVPEAAIRLLEPPATNIENEFEFLREELRRQSGDTVILVTSPVESRRVKAIWRGVVGNHAQAIVRHAASEPSDLAHWWRTTQDVEDVVHELLGLINAWLGFAAKPLK